MFFLEDKRCELMVNGLLIYSDIPKDTIKREAFLKRIIKSIETDKKIIVYSQLELFLRMLSANENFDTLVNHFMNFKFSDLDVRCLVTFILDTSKEINYRAKLFYEYYYAKLNGYIINLDNELELKALLDEMAEYYKHGINLDDIKCFTDLIGLDYDMIRRHFNLVSPKMKHMTN